MIGALVVFNLVVLHYKSESKSHIESESESKSESENKSESEIEYFS